MKILSSENIITVMDKDNTPVLYIDSGETIRVDTLDCYANGFYKEGATINVRASNPATGPIYINGSNAGDTLKITIEKIELADRGVIKLVKNDGVLGDRVKEADLEIISMDKNFAYYKGYKIPLKPMVGVIGVAPRDKGISTFIPDSHGGNMDCNQIKENSVLYLPVFTDGALLSLGDLHGLMGDGELGDSGLETYGTVQLKVEVLKDIKIENPIVIVDERLYQIAASENLDDAINIATNNLADILVKNENIKDTDAIRLLTMVGVIGICQVVNPKKTVKLSVPIDLLKNNIFK